MKIYTKEELYGENATGRLKNGMLARMILDAIMDKGSACNIHEIRDRVTKMGIYPFSYRNLRGFHLSLLCGIENMIKKGILAKGRKEGQAGMLYGLPEDFTQEDLTRKPMYGQKAKKAKREGAISKGELPENH